MYLKPFFTEERNNISNIRVIDEKLYFLNYFFDNSSTWKMYEYDLKTDTLNVIAKDNGDKLKGAIPGIFYSDDYILIEDYTKAEAENASETHKFNSITSEIYNVKTSKSEEIKFTDRYSASTFWSISIY